MAARTVGARGHLAAAAEAAAVLDAGECVAGGRLHHVLRELHRLMLAQTVDQPTSSLSERYCTSLSERCHPS